MVAQQGGELDDAGLAAVAGLAVGIQDGIPGRGGHVRDGGAFAGTELPTDGVVHPAPGFAVEGGEVVDEAVGGAGAVDGDQQIPPVLGGDLGNGLVQDLDVISCRVGASAASAQFERQ